jgi:hypothetical protein
MKTLPRFCLLLLCGFLLGKAVANDQIVEREPLTSEQIEELVGPIALYPDPLIALILPASTFPSDIVLAARYLESGGVVESVTAEPWDDSVRALARYREVIDYLDKHLAWTRSLGHCFLDQRDDVMDAIQRVRARARTAGLLQDTAEQHVIVETEEIRIVPAQPTVIYVPRYDPDVIWHTSPVYYGYSRPFITFGIGWRVGTWLNFDCDWRGRSIRIVHRPTHWYHSPKWDDRDRFRHYSGSHWTRRTPYPRHDNRFDRSPRTAGYVPRGADHRHWSDRNRDNDHSRHHTRPDHNRQAPSSHGQHARDWEDRRRRETNSRQTGLAPDVSPISAPVIPPVATPEPAQQYSPQRSHRPERGQSVAERTERLVNRDRGDRRNDSPEHRVSPRPERIASPQITQRSQPAAQPPRQEPSHQVRRVEAQDRSEQRRRSGNDEQERRSNARSGGNRGVEREAEDR